MIDLYPIDDDSTEDRTTHDLDCRFVQVGSETARDGVQISDGQWVCTERCRERHGKQGRDNEKL